MVVLDANILVRAVLGLRVLGLLRKYAGQVEFLASDAAFNEAREHLPEILTRRGVPVAAALEILNSVGALVQTIEFDTYRPLNPWRGSVSQAATKTTGRF